MLEHLNAQATKPQRVVVVGAAGFVGNAVVSRLERDTVPVVKVTREIVDLAAADAGAKLSALLRPGDAVVAAAARAPCKNADMLIENMVIARSLGRALSQPGLSHVVNISSDAVYADSDRPLTEGSCASPNSMHGIMHLGREVLLANEIKAAFAILRPSLLYGAGDPHDGYGPNRFRRLAAKGEDIVLFGEGEERRDHVFIDDAAELVARVLYRRSSGVLNVATGEVHSFMEIARMVVGLAKTNAKIRTSARSGPMPHNGYRPFDASGCRRAFPDFRFTTVQDGLRKAADA